MRRVLALVGLPLIVIAAGCAPAGSEPGGGADDRWEPFHQRAVEVAEAWRPGTAWTAGYVLLQEPTVLLGDPDFTPETEQAFRNGWYREQIAVPTDEPGNTAIRFPDATLSVPLVSAATAYRQLDQGDPPPCEGRPRQPTPEKRPGFRPKPESTSGPVIEPGPDGPTRDLRPTVEPGPDGPVSNAPSTACLPLTVTAVRLGTAPVHTSRGKAHVPAWVFTVAELRALVARLAVDPGAVTAVPRGVAPIRPAPEGVVGAESLQAVDGARLTWRIGVGACDTGATPLVQERDDVVVVGGGVTPATGICTDQLLVKPVTATLKAPLGDRPVLDVATGAPLVVRP
ncbi:hypothetical protein OOK41_28395 [Micromonospora sp. NBC_01655]|uniref:hypothetical protein n=1 Tax=Micromonospora sp. NBC_01655 TaxID=2975983 RepID=UPI0022550D8A|nr:hypothetical protein [Micromonospora sp. NBC_01655]MCX4474182.1 hypothetical protein [Micromonospora sp. NBC_01655]